nr:F420H2 dehydrogenase subunit FpoA [Methanohalophilus portucalensis]
MSYMSDSNIVYSYIPVAVFLVVSLLMPPMTMLIVKLLSPRSKGAEKYSTYESGSVPTGPARIQFSVEYYLYAIAFVLFDIEVLFLYPWAMIYRGNTGVDTTVAVVEMLVFIFVLLFGYAFLWKKGALKWMKN